MDWLIPIVSYLVCFHLGHNLGFYKHKQDPNQVIVVLFDDKEANNVLWYSWDKRFIHQSKDYDSGMKHLTSLYHKDVKIYVAAL